MKDWQKGYEIEYLKKIKEEFLDYNNFSLSPFSEMKPNTIAETLEKGHLKMIGTWDSKRAWIESHKINVCRKISAGGNVIIGQKEKGDQVIKRISGDKNILIHHINNFFKEPVWMFIWEECEKSKEIAHKTGFKKVGSKVSSFSEIYGVYFKGDRKHPFVPNYEKFALKRLSLNKKDISNIVNKIQVKLDSLPEFTNHYSNYNSKGSWSGLSLRGYRKDPAFITKPIEMNKKWKAENPGCLDWQLEDTCLRWEFFEIEKLLDMLPGNKHRIRFMRLKPDGGLKRHTDLVDPDQGISDGKLARIHFPIITNKKVKFQNWDWDASSPEIHMKVGEAWYLDVRKPHCAVNFGNEYRIHLVVDVESNASLRVLL